MDTGLVLSSLLAAGLFSASELRECSIGANWEQQIAKLQDLHSSKTTHYAEKSAGAAKRESQ